MVEKGLSGTKKIFVADRHEIHRHSLVAVLESVFQDKSLSCSVDEMSITGLMDKLRKSELSGYDLGFVDMNTGSSEGIDAIKGLTQSTNIPIIAMSIYNESEYEKAALEAGAKGYFAKEDGLAKIEEIIGEYLK